MRFLAALILTAVAAPFLCAAESNNVVKVFTLKDGRAIIAVQTLTSNNNGKTAYLVTQPDGKSVAFDSTQVDKVEEGSLADWQRHKAPEPQESLVIGVRKVAAAPVAAAAPAAAPNAPPASAPPKRKVEPYTGAPFGLAPEYPRDRRLELLGFGNLSYEGTLAVTKYGVFPLKDIVRNDPARTSGTRGGFLSGLSSEHATLQQGGSTQIKP